MKRVFYAIACLALLMLSGCKDTKALKEAADKANALCPTTLANLGEATAVALGDKAIEYTVTPLPALVEGESVDKSLIARYLVLELQRTNPELMSQLVDSEYGVKCNLSGTDEPVEVSADEVKRFSEDFTASGGKVAPILLPLYNQQLSAKLPMEIAEGLTLKDVKVSNGKETFFYTVDDDKTKFDAVRGNILKSMDNAAEKVKLSGLNLSMVLPLLEELNYEAIFRYSTKSGKETYMQLTADEIGELLKPAQEEAE